MKRKTFKKAGAAVLSMAMLVSVGALALPVNAAAGDALTVKVSNNFINVTGIKVYQVAKRNASTGQWRWNAPFNTVIKDTVDFARLHELDATQMNNLAKALKFGTKLNTNEEMDALAKTLVSEQNNARIASVDGGVSVIGEGYYLIVPESLNNENVFQPSLVAIDSTGTTFTELTAKANPLPLEKKIIRTEPGMTSQGGDPSDTSVGIVGSEVGYEITSQLPEYYDIVTHDMISPFELTDDPSAGITINNTDFSESGSDVKVFFIDPVDTTIETEVTDEVTIAAEGDGFKITVDGDMVGDYQGYGVLVTFKAKINNNAVTGDASCADAEENHNGFKGNPNTVSLSWGNNFATGGYLPLVDPDSPFTPRNPERPIPYDPFNPDEQPEDPGVPPVKNDTVTTYVGKITLAKQGDNVNGLLNGATFRVQGVDNDFTGTFTTKRNGTIDFGFLPAGTYRLVETKAPKGFKTISTSYEFTVANRPENAGVHDEFTTFTVTEVAPTERVELTDVSDTTNGSNVRIVVTDPPADTLPATGGIGTVLFTIGGAAIIILAGIFFIMYMKKRKAVD